MELPILTMSNRTNALYGCHVLKIYVYKNIGHTTALLARVEVLFPNSWLERDSRPLLDNMHAIRKNLKETSFTQETCKKCFLPKNQFSAFLGFKKRAETMIFRKCRDYVTTSWETEFYSV